MKLAQATWYRCTPATHKVDNLLHPSIFMGKLRAKVDTTSYVKGSNIWMKKYHEW